MLFRSHCLCSYSRRQKTRHLIHSEMIKQDCIYKSHGLTISTPETPPVDKGKIQISIHLNGIEYRCANPELHGMIKRPRRCEETIVANGRSISNRRACSPPLGGGGATRELAVNAIYPHKDPNKRQDGEDGCNPMDETVKICC